MSNGSFDDKEMDSFIGNFEVDEETLECYKRLNSELDAISSKIKRKSRLKLENK